MLNFRAHSEDEPMDEDGVPTIKEDGDDLAKYKLEEYDKESSSIGMYVP